MTDQLSGSAAKPKRRRPDRAVIGRVEDFPASGRKLVEVNGREIGVFRVDGKFHAVLNRCPHLGGPLCFGQIVNPVSSSGPGDVRIDQTRSLLTCPWHNWEFDLATGQSFWDPAKMHTRPFPVDVETGEAIAEAVQSGSTALVEGPYQAELIDVDVEGEYVVISLRPSRTKGMTTDTTGGAA
jgi:3-phenylpropionate/trans-cinnamate dioxygenase ferredoxin subunit